MSALTDQLRSALAGRYEIEREIGSGGMATVYLARDPRHDRRVALKLLNPELGAVLGVERFLAEIRVTANLQHPNLLPLFDSGEVGGLLFYVMPFVEGESLRVRLAREKQLPIDEAVRIATAVAGALDYAHRHGVVHRDLKPENILLHDGQPVIADFGIALAVSNAGGGRITQTGLSLGTPQYMSPEQATGDRGIDGRTDIYSLGAVLYEMLGGEPPHHGTSAQAIIAKLMTEEVRPVTVLRRAVPQHIAAAVHCALEKLPADRFATAAQFSDALAGTRPVTATAAHSATAARQAWLPWAVAGAAGVVAAIAVSALLARSRSDAPTSAPSLHATVPISLVGQIELARPLVVSPDGSRIVYVAPITGIARIFARSSDIDEFRPIPGTDGAQGVLFSYDGAWLAFRTIDGLLRKMPAGGGPITTIGRLPSLAGAAWGPGDQIVYSLGFGSTLWQLSANGGEPRQITRLDSARKETVHVAPIFLPDGKSVVFGISTTAVGTPRTMKLAVATLDGQVTQLDIPGSPIAFVEPSYLIFVTPDGTVSGVPFDAKKRRVTGQPVALLDDASLRANGTPFLAAARNGSLLVYLRGLPGGKLAVLTAAGETQLLPAEPKRFRHPRVSPDGTRIALAVSDASGGTDIWVYDMRSAALTKVTLDGKSNDPVWNPDGKHIAISRLDSLDGTVDVYTVAADGSEKPTLLVGGPGSQWPAFYLPGGRGFLFGERKATPQIYIAMLTPDGQRKDVVNVPGFTTRLPGVSPDGKWLAYTSNESGRSDILVRPADGGPGRWQLSVSGGTQPVFAHDGQTIYYREGGRVVAATYSGGATFTVTTRRTVADDRFVEENTINYDVFPDGKRLVVLIPSEQASQFAVVANWGEELRRKLRAK